MVIFIILLGTEVSRICQRLTRDGEHSQYSNAHRAIIYVQFYTTPGANPVGLIIRKGYMRSNQNISKDI